MDGKKAHAELVVRAKELAAIMAELTDALHKRDWMKFDGLQDAFHSKTDEVFAAQRALIKAR